MKEMQKVEKSVADNLKKLREKSVFTKEQVVARMQLLGCDIDDCDYSRIEAGERCVEDNEMVALHYILQVEYGDFLENVDI